MISAIILAAGESKRMGEQKLLMKWGTGTVLSHIITVFAEAGLEDVLVVTGSDHARIVQLVEAESHQHPVRWIFNPSHASGEMLSSIQCGLRDLADRATGAAMIGLGDQPQVKEETVRMILEEQARSTHPLIVPSHSNRRGHPWLVGRLYWDEILHMHSPETLRDLLNRNRNVIRYVQIGNSSIFADLDTPEDYLRSQPG